MHVEPSHTRAKPLSGELIAAIVRPALAARYAAPVLRVESEHVEVPDGKALTIARDAVFSQGFNTDCVKAIDHASLPWFAVPADGVTLYRQHGSAEEVVTQLAFGDPSVQIVSTLDDWKLIRVADGATGWLQPGIELDSASKFEHKETEFDAKSFVSSALAFVDAPYVWGGTSSDGVDCSGLVQRSAWQSNQVWLPRHSTALLRVGARCSRGDAIAGDILVLKRKPATYLPLEDGERRHPMHVAIAIDSETAIHASRDAWKVVSEPIVELKTRYTVLSVRRLGEQS